MDYLKYSEKLDYLLEMVQKGRLFSLQQASEKFECSKSTIKRMLVVLRNQGNEIIYCSTAKKFYLKK